MIKKRWNPPPKNHTLSFQMSCSARNQGPPGHAGTISQDVLKTYVEKHITTYAYFRVRTNQLCIIVQKYHPIPGHLLGKIASQYSVKYCPGGRIVPGDCPGKCPPGRCPQGKIHSNNKCPRDVVPGEKFTPTSKLWMAKLPRRNSLTTIAAPSGIISPLHHFTIRENTEVKRQNRR